MIHYVQTGADPDGLLYAECPCGWSAPTVGEPTDLYMLFNRHLAETFGHQTIP